MPDALSNATLGHHLIALTSWFHYGLGTTLGQLQDILASHLHTQVTPGGLLDGWRRLAGILTPWYEQIALDTRAGSVLHADETGWRVDGTTRWLWCFTNKDNCYYLIDRSRGSPASARFFTEAFDGTLVTDFWAAYESVATQDRQYCLVHLLRELEKVERYNTSAAWAEFAKSLRRLVRDGIRLRKRADVTPGRYRSRLGLIHRRLVKLADSPRSTDDDVNRLTERLSRHRDHLFTFLDKPEVPLENNFAERRGGATPPQIRPAVILRNNQLCNRSPRGAETQAVLMSIYRTLTLRGHEATETIAGALRTYVSKGNLPKLPEAVVASG